jgi:MYXO-CTERM domain-containing protein
MSKHLRGLLSPIAAMVAILAMMTTPARADLELILSETGFATVYFSATTAGGTGSLTATSPLVYGDFTITGLAASQLNASFSNLQSTNLSVTNNTGSAHSLTIQTYGNNYTLTHQGWINNANTAIDPPFTGSPAGLVVPKGTTAGAQPPTFSGISFDNGTVNVLFNRTGTNYSLTSQASVNVGGAAGIHFTETLQVSAATPEPPSWALAALGFVGLVGYGLRRRKALSV